MMNRLHNIHNPYQGKDRRVLCVCSAGLLRSPTAALVLHKEFGYNTRSCGINIDYALIPFDEALGSWADEIVVMEEYMKDGLPEKFQAKAIILGIPDDFEYMNPTLQRLIKEKYDEITSSNS